MPVDIVQSEAGGLLEFLELSEEVIVGDPLPQKFPQEFYWIHIGRSYGQKKD